MPSLAPPPPGGPPLFTPRSTFTFPSSSSPEPPYVLHLAPLSSPQPDYVVATSEPSLGLTVLDGSTLKPVGRIDYGGSKRGRVTGLKSVRVGGGEEAVFASFAEGASVGVWDMRRMWNAEPSIELRGASVQKGGARDLELMWERLGV